MNLLNHDNPAFVLHEADANISRHIQKLILHRASMKFYENYLKQKIS